jgi:hypothetical protein
MSQCHLTVVGARVEPHALVPTLTFTVRLTVGAGVRVHAAALRCHVPAEADRLYELFGEPVRWHDTLKPLLWTQVSIPVPGFTGTADVDVPVTCSYDLEVAASKYFHALDAGEIPLLFQFSGTVFFAGDGGFSVSPIGWDEDASYRLPVTLFRELMDRYFPNSTWLRLGRDQVDALQRFKGRHALPTFDHAISALLARVAAEEAM